MPAVGAVARDAALCGDPAQRGRWADAGDHPVGEPAAENTQRFPKSKSPMKSGLFRFLLRTVNTDFYSVNAIYPLIKDRPAGDGGGILGPVDHKLVGCKVVSCYKRMG